MVHVESNDGCVGASIGRTFFPIFFCTLIWPISVRHSLSFRSNFKLLAVNGKLYAIGGQSLSNVECYNPENDWWNFVASMPNPLAEFSACECKGKIYVIGGYTTRGRKFFVFLTWLLLKHRSFSFSGFFFNCCKKTYWWNETEKYLCHTGIVFCLFFFLGLHLGFVIMLAKHIDFKTR